MAAVGVRLARRRLPRFLSLRGLEIDCGVIGKTTVVESVGIGFGLHLHLGESKFGAKSDTTELLFTA